MFSVSVKIEKQPLLVPVEREMWVLWAFRGSGVFPEGSCFSLTDGSVQAAMLQHTASPQDGKTKDRIQVQVSREEMSQCSCVVCPEQRHKSARCPVVKNVPVGCLKAKIQPRGGPD